MQWAAQGDQKNDPHFYINFYESAFFFFSMQAQGSWAKEL